MQISLVLPNSLQGHASIIRREPTWIIKLWLTRVTSVTKGLTLTPGTWLWIPQRYSGAGTNDSLQVTHVFFHPLGTQGAPAMRHALTIICTVDIVGSKTNKNSALLILTCLERVNHLTNKQTSKNNYSKQESEHVVPFSQLSNDITFKVKIQVIQIVKCPHDFLLIFYHSVYYYFAPLSSYISSVLSSISGTLVNMR
jgi:hypothetical protein